MSRTIVIVVLLLVVACALALTQFFYFSPKELATEKGARILFESPIGEDKALVLEKIKKELLENEQF
ncbi:MAG: hypothetical protein AAB766_03935, partial [Patescibacteria group bacterium]